MNNDWDLFFDDLVDNVYHYPNGYIAYKKWWYWFIIDNQWKQIFKDGLYVDYCHCYWTDVNNIITVKRNWKWYFLEIYE